MTDRSIVIKGARQHNLKNINLEIPRDLMVIITGLSGSGKSSLAFNTLFAEGQRRYIESLSAYARQFLGQMEKPDVDYIEGLSPAISIDQKAISKNPRSTVGTVTEIYDYFRLLFARIGIPHCPKCGREIQSQSVENIVNHIMKMKKNSKIVLLSPVVEGRKGVYNQLFEDLIREGYARVRIDGEIHTLGEKINLDKYKMHNIEIIVDRLIIGPNIRKRLTDSIETALKVGNGKIIVDEKGSVEHLFSEQFSCDSCGIGYDESTPRMFSFNSPYGACSTCGGLGGILSIDPDLVVPDKKKCLNERAINVGGFAGGYMQSMLEHLGKRYGFRLDIPFQNLSAKHQNIILYGSGGERISMEYTSRSSNFLVKGKFAFEGVIPILQRRHAETKSERVRHYYQSLMRIHQCTSCNGARLRPESLAVTINDKNITQFTSISIEKILDIIQRLVLSNREKIICKQILKEILSRLKFLINVGLNYLTLDRASMTLSSGESQRIRLATQIGSSLVGVLYILDEPSIGLHQRDNSRLLDTLKHLRDLGNTLIIVEHDEDTILSSDHIVDLGPGAGAHGGRVVAEGTPQEIINHPESITGKYLSGRLQIPVPFPRNKGNGKFLVIRGATHHNLKNIDVQIPLGEFVCITGVSGSGKSTLINDILYRFLAQHFYGSKESPGAHSTVEGVNNLDKAIIIDQSPIGRTPRSNPATYSGLFTPIREFYSQLPESRARGYSLGRFSFNVKSGRCENCQGAGTICIEMQFLPDVYVTCDVCKGKRYNSDTLQIISKGKTITDVLNMTVEEALQFFQNLPKVKRRLQTLMDVGLSYIKLGQPATTLSGGEAQRVKLATQLSKISTGNTLFILDEPTTGLHFADVQKLLDVLIRLTDRKNTVIVIEHNLDVIKTADHIIDLGPEGGDNGGQIVAEGSPEDVSKIKSSHTGQYLRKILRRQFEKPEDLSTRITR